MTRVVFRREGPPRRKCRRNHACHVGGYDLDGCREFIATAAEGTDAALTCATRLP
ncbi:hypothetical protein AAZX31_18G237400 [Glycine max]